MPDDIQKQITALEDALAATPPDSPNRAVLQQMLADLQAKQPPSPPVQTGGINLAATQIDSVDTVAGRDVVKGDQVLGDKHEHYYGPGTSDRTTLIANYLSGVIAAASHLTLTETDNTDPEQHEVLLEDVYTRLEVASTVGEAESERANPPKSSDDMRQRQQSVLGALSQRRRLVLLGPPGSGKSTLARFLTLCLARATLGNPAWLDRLGNEWTCGALLPIRIELTGFADWLT